MKIYEANMKYILNPIKRYYIMLLNVKIIENKLYPIKPQLIPSLITLKNKKVNK